MSLIRCHGFKVFMRTLGKATPLGPSKLCKFQALIRSRTVSIEVSSTRIIYRQDKQGICPFKSKINFSLQACLGAQGGTQAPDKYLNRDPVYHRRRPVSQMVTQSLYYSSTYAHANSQIMGITNQSYQIILKRWIYVQFLILMESLCSLIDNLDSTLLYSFYSVSQQSLSGVCPNPAPLPQLCAGPSPVFLCAAFIYQAKNSSSFISQYSLWLSSPTSFIVLAASSLLRMRLQSYSCSNCFWDCIISASPESRMQRCVFSDISSILSKLLKVTASKTFASCNVIQCVSDYLESKVGRDILEDWQISIDGLESGETVIFRRGKASFACFLKGLVGKPQFVDQLLSLDRVTHQGGDEGVIGRLLTGCCHELIYFIQKYPKFVALFYSILLIQQFLLLCHWLREIEEVPQLFPIIYSKLTLYNLQLGL